MVDALQDQVARDVAFWRDLADDDQGIFDRFSDLAERTRPHLGGAIPIRMDPGSAFSPASGMDYWTSRMPADLVAEWGRFAVRWKAFALANPLVRIAGFLSDVSESHDSSSFPHGREAGLREWVADGFPDPVPFDDRHDVATEGWKTAFRRAFEDADGEWVEYDDGRLLRVGRSFDPGKLEEARRLDEGYALGMGSLRIREGVRIGEDRFDGDVLLGMLWIEAESLAVAVGRNLPTEGERRMARDAWNDATARSHLARLRMRFPEVERGEGSRLPSP